MKESQYIDMYLDAASENGWTPGTFLSYTLTSKQKDYRTSYEKALMNAIHRRLKTGEVVAIKSARGGTAYVRTQDAMV